jgi:YfiH family protein
MKKVQIEGLGLWQFDQLGTEAGIKHFVSDRGPYGGEKEFTLSYSSSPDREEIRRNRHRVAAALGIASNRLFFPSQVHKTRIVQVAEDTPVDELMETDALITNKRGIGLAVMSADCVPIILYDKKNQAIGAIHSGWRGTVARILEKTLHEMQRVYGTQGADVIAGIGPSVCQDSYEVGEEVVHAVDHAFGKDQGLMIPQPEGKAKLDLWKANALQLLAFGVPATRIEVSNLCTVKNNNYFFSARRQDAGRFAAGIVLA